MNIFSNEDSSFSDLEEIKMKSVLDTSDFERNADKLRRGNKLKNLGKPIAFVIFGFVTLICLRYWWMLLVDAIID